MDLTKVKRHYCETFGYRDTVGKTSKEKKRRGFLGGKFLRTKEISDFSPGKRGYCHLDRCPVGEKSGGWTRIKG